MQIMASKFLNDSLERIMLEMTSSLDLQLVLTTITQGLAEEAEASFARIWLIGPGDMCDVCHWRKTCTERRSCLHLEASAGIYTNLNGSFRRLPLGGLLIGKIAQDQQPIFTNNLSGDKRFYDKGWIKKNKFRSYAGYPLIFRDELLGVGAMFSQRAMASDELKGFSVFANQAAIAIRNSQLFNEVEQLKDRLKAECVYLNEEIKLNYNFDEIIGQSALIEESQYQLQQVAPTDATVLILGETGTGKELFARAIHNLSLRNTKSLIRVNCSALQPNLIESELFGHEKGAFTGAHIRKIGRFELADGGTIFLDEIGDLPFGLQAKLLRVLQEGELERVGGSKTIAVDVRVIAASNRDLKEAVKSGQFREDLYYRLNVFPLIIPSLRERKEDVPLLINHFIRKYSKKFGKNIETIPRKSIKALDNYSWPGNVRELENIVERAVILSTSNTLMLAEMVGLHKKESLRSGTSRSLLEVERDHIVKTLTECDWVIEGNHGAANRLGLNPSTLRFRMKKLNIERPKSTTTSMS